MTEKIKIGDIDVPMKANGATLFYYRDKFGRDLLEDMNKITLSEITGESIMCLQQLAFIMAKQADDTIPDFLEWLDSFDTFPFDEIAIPVVTLWQKSSISTSAQKNAASRRKGK